MEGSMFSNVPQIIQTYNVSRTIGEATTVISSFSVVEQTAMTTNSMIAANTDISPIASLGFAILILATVAGNSLVLLAFLLDKRLHSPSFYLIANMAFADLLLGLAVLPFSSVLELLHGRWIFGQTFCSAWLALDVLCCTASIMALMAVSIDRYIGVTRPLNYSTIMTFRRTVYLILVTWAVSILTSVVPLFGLTDREKRPDEAQIQLGRFETCKVNKNAFYTIFSSMISFYIPVIILLILYSRVYQEAKRQGQKLENEKRRLYQIDYQIASEHIRQKQTQSNGHPNGKSISDQRTPNQTPKYRRAYSSISENNKTEATASLLNNNNNSNQDEEESLDRTLTLSEDVQLKKDDPDLKNHNSNDDTVQSGSSLAHHITNARRSLGKRISSTLKRGSQSYVPHLPHDQHSGQMSHKDELLIIKRKLHNLKREKKAFRTLGLILGALLICWLPFFVTLPVMSIRQRHGMIHDDNTENTWFKITFWLGYCNSALNPFVYAFSNRAIRRAFRQVIFRRFCCCCMFQCRLCRYFCPNKRNDFTEQSSTQYQRTRSGSFTTQTSQVAPRRTSSFTAELARALPKSSNDYDQASQTPVTPVRTPASGGLVVSFADFLAETNDDEEEEEEEEEESLASPNAKQSIQNLNSS